MIEQRFGIKFLPMWREDHGGNEALFIAGVRIELSKILLSRAGRALADSLRFHQKTILLMPYEGNDGNAQEDGVTPGSQQSVVLFTPLTRASCCSSGKAATLLHEILFHELVHSLRRVTGHPLKYRLNNKLQPYGYNEEFLAILVTNIFISDVTNLNKTSLRENWQGHATLDRELADSFRFFSLGTKAFNLIANFCDQNRGFTGMLAKVSARFNPIAAYYKNRRKAFEMAATGDAELVFEGMTPMDYVQKGGAWERIIPYAGPPAKSGRQR
jgi:hypothetical protein